MPERPSVDEKLNNMCQRFKFSGMEANGQLIPEIAKSQAEKLTG